MKYTKEEILQIIRANNDQINQLGIDGWRTDDLNFELNITDWIDDFNLLDWDELALFYDKMFQLNLPQSDWQKTMLPKKEKTLGDFCEFISNHAVKPEIKPIKLLGRYCEEASIFRCLINKLKEAYPDIETIKPSSVVEKYMDKNWQEVIYQTNLMAPGVLPLVKYKANRLEKYGEKLMGVGFLILIIDAFFNNWIIGSFAFGIFVSGCYLLKQSAKVPAEQFEFEGITTFRDLVFKIKKHRNSLA
jgi:hypothetical protein